MGDIVNTALILFSLGLLLSYSVLSFLGFVAFISVTNPSERDVFSKVCYVPLMMALALGISLVFFINLRHTGVSPYYLPLMLFISLLPIPLIYFNCKVWCKGN